jgi:hypothetical protein
MRIAEYRDLKQQISNTKFQILFWPFEIAILSYLENNFVIPLSPGGRGQG